MNSKLTIYIILFFLLAIVFCFQIYIGTTISSVQSLATELVAPKDKPQEWGVKNWIPMKYRALFRWIVTGTYKLISPKDNAIGFYSIFIFYSFLFLYLTLMSIFYFLSKLGFNRNYSLLGCILFLISPPILLAYKLPVHTKEDVLAYFFVVLGLIAILNKKTLLICFISIFGALTRENTLIVPLTYLLFTKFDPIHKRIIFSSLPVLAFISLRFLLGYESYNPVDGFFINIRYYIQTIFFFFITFGAMWLPALSQWILLRKTTSHKTWEMGIMINSFGLVAFIVLATNVIFAMVQENRILFILFPWIIVLTLSWIHQNKMKLLFFRKNPIFWIVFLIPITIFILTFSFKPELLEIFMAGLLANYSKPWFIVSFINILFLFGILVIESIPYKKQNTLQSV